jgi:hypothetical protein
MTTIDIEDIEGTPEKPDFRRANGAPMWTDEDGKNQRGSRPSGWGKTLDDENALVSWKINTAAKGVALDPALQAEWIAVSDDDKPQKRKLQEKAIQAGRGNQASDTGTALHAMSERWEDPEDDFNPGKFRPSLEAYSGEMERVGVVSELFEYTVVNEEYRAAGTVDRLYRLTRPLFAPDGAYLPEGTFVVGDLKTGKSLDFSLPGYHVQMAIYAQGRMYNVESDKFMPTPDINQKWGIIVHMPSNAETCEFIWCDLEVGNYGAYLVNEIKDWRKKWRNGTYSSPPVEVMAVTKIEVEVEVEAEVFDDKAWMDMLFPFIKARIATIRDNVGAAADLPMVWPKDVPPPKAMNEVHHFIKILDMLDALEAQHGVQFPINDPRGVPGVHSSEAAVNNFPPSQQVA